MLIAKLSISYDRGMEWNKPEDVGLEAEPTTTKDGGVIRGLGTHWKSEEDRLRVKELDKENNRVRAAFRERFLVTPLDSVYIMQRLGEAKEFLGSLEIRPDIEARVTEFYLGAAEEMSSQDMTEWSKKIKRQLGQVGLGRGKEADEEGLRALETLVRCPLIGKETASRVLEMVASVRLNKMDRIELKRSIETLDVKVDSRILAPRRVGPVPQGEPVA